MKFDSRRLIWFTVSVVMSLVIGCAEPGSSGVQATQAALPQGPDGLGPTIGMLAEVFASNPVRVSGYGLVGGLNGTGSGECPEPIREELEKYIRQHFQDSSVNVNTLIESPDTAVVIVNGIIPPAASKGQRFDVKVSVLPGTQTTSLKGGWLYGCDLCESRQLGISIRSLAVAEGPVYTDSSDAGLLDGRTGFCLGGGAVLDEYKINLALRRPDYRIANQIRNRINERFGYDTAWALAPGSIELRVPAKYNDDKTRFIRLVGATYLIETPELVEKRIASRVRGLASGPNKDIDELVLEAIGKEAAAKLAGLLSSPDPEVRFHAARCMSDLGDPRGRETLWSIASDKKSAYRVAAVNAIVDSPVRQDAASLLRILLRDDDFSVRLAAYESLVRLNDASVSRQVIGESFYLDRISAPGKPAIYISRRQQARVVLFGAPVYCRSNFFIETPDKTITINAPPDEQTVSIIRRHPKRPDTIIDLKTSLALSDIIRTLCSDPSGTGRDGPGLGVPFSALVPILKQMVDSGAVQAEFHISPLPQEMLNIKN